MQCIWLFKGFNPCPTQQPHWDLVLTFPSRRLTSKEPFLHFIQDYISIYGKKSRCQPDELNNRNKWRKLTRSYALTKSLIIVQVGPKEVTNTLWPCLYVLGQEGVWNSVQVILPAFPQFTFHLMTLSLCFRPGKSLWFFSGGTPSISSVHLPSRDTVSMF